MSPIFPEPPIEGRFVGMTINERLCAVGLMKQWDIAIANRDINRAVAILVETELPEASARQTVEAVLNKQL